MAKITIVQRRLTNYRVQFFSDLRKQLQVRGIELILVHGNASKNEISKLDEGFLEWAIKVKNIYIKVGSINLCWVPTPKNALDADLIILTQENSLIANYLHLARRYIGLSHIAFWGHGANLQTKNHYGLSEKFKRWTAKQVDWWFAYTEMSVDLVVNSGFSKKRITNLENSIDTKLIINNIIEINYDVRELVYQEFGWMTGPIGIFIGSLYDQKRLPFLFDAVERVRSEIPDFKMLLIGDGPLRNYVASYCDDRSWCRWIGSKNGKDKARYLTSADIMLNPGLVGLSIIDSFAARIPIITTDCGIHSPEIVYLKTSYNGIMTENNIDSFVAEICAFLKDENKKIALKKGCALSAQHYTLENMVNNFVEGIEVFLSEK